MGITPTQAAQDLIARLKGKWHGNYGMACCPAHKDRSPSLSVKPGEKALLFHCFAGCSSTAIIDALRALGDLPRPTQREDARESRDLSAFCRELWSKALPVGATPAQLYLDRRGIGHSLIGKYDPRAVAKEEGKRLTLPALYLPITRRREIIALARVFLNRDGSKCSQLESPKRTLGDPRGGAVQIGKIIGDHLNLAEGFEDAESAIAMHGLPGCWSVSGTELYASLIVPDHIRSMTIYSQHGKAAAQGIDKARAHLGESEARSIDIVLPPPGGDWNDAWRRRG